MAENPLTAQPQGAPAPKVICCEPADALGTAYCSLEAGHEARHRFNRAAPLAERQGQEAEKRDFERRLKEAIIEFSHCAGPSLSWIEGVLRRLLADLGAPPSQPTNAGMTVDPTRCIFCGDLRNVATNVTTVCTSAKNRLSQDTAGNRHHAYFAAPAPPPLPSVPPGPPPKPPRPPNDRPVAAPQSNPAPRCWCGELFVHDVHESGEHLGGHKPKLNQRTGPAERRVTDLGCKGARDFPSNHRAPWGNHSCLSDRFGPRDRRQPQAAAPCTGEEDCICDNCLPAALPGKEGSQPMQPECKSRNGRWFVVRDIGGGDEYLHHDGTWHGYCGENGFWIGREEAEGAMKAAAPPLVTAEQAREWLDHKGWSYQTVAAFASSLLAQQQARIEELRREFLAYQARYPATCTACGTNTVAGEENQRLSARLREAEQAETELLEDAHAALDDAGVERAIDGNNLSVETRIVRLGADAADLRGLLRELWHSNQQRFETTGETAGRIRQALAKTEAGS